jgi:hypothetical protein
VCIRLCEEIIVLNILYLHAEDRDLSKDMLNDCYNYDAAAINAKGEPFPTEPLIMALLFSQHKMIEWLTKQISKHESLINDNKEVKKSKQQEDQNLGRENAHDYIRKNERIHYIDDY